MPSWTEVQGYLRSRYRLQTDEAQHFVIGFALEGGGGLTGPGLDADDQAFVGEAAKLFPEGDVTPATWKDWGVTSRKRRPW